MSDKIKKIYDALVDGAVEGKSGKDLFAYVADKCPKATSKKIVKASLLALSDPHIKDANVLQVIYALAIKHRLDPVHKDDYEVEPENEPQPVEVKAKAPAKRKSVRSVPASVADAQA